MASPENNCKHVRSIKVEYSVKKPEIAGSTLKIIALVIPDAVRSNIPIKIPVTPD